MTLAQLRQLLRADFARMSSRDDRMTVFVFRLGQFAFADKRRRLLAFVVWKILDRFYLRWMVGAELPPTVQCGPGLMVHHAGRGIVLHPDTVIGARLNIYHGVTIGQAGPGRPPIVGDDVYLGVDAKLLGPVTVASNVSVGAGAVVVRDVPANRTVVGVPAREVGGST
jgi:serine O-acetyltransferase